MICKCCRQPMPSKSKYLWIFDNGHGGIINGVYQTAGKRSPIWDDGTQEDVSLSARTKKANDIYRESNKPCIYVSIHANGYTAESANGWEVYTSEGETQSDHIATVLFNEADREFPNYTMRKDTYSDGDVDKEANFYVLIHTAMPAILSENFFMTNQRDCNLLMSESGRDRIAKIHIEMINKIESE